MTDEPDGGAADPSLKLERVGCPAPVCGAVFEIPVGRLGRNVYCLECGRRMTARPVGHTGRLRAKEAGERSGSGADIERLPLIAVLDDIRSLWNVGSIFRNGKWAVFDPASPVNSAYGITIFLELILSLTPAYRFGIC